MLELGMVANVGCKPKPVPSAYAGEGLLCPAVNTSTTVQGQHATEAGGLFILLALENRLVSQLLHGVAD